MLLMRGKLASLKVVTVSSAEALSALTVEWNALAKATDASSVFLLHEWHMSAWKWLSSSCTLAVLQVVDGGRTVGILPLVRERYSTRFGAATRLRTFEIPDTQQVSLLCAADDADSVAGAIVAELARISRERTLLQMQKLSDTPANAALGRRLGEESRLVAGSGDSCPCVPLNGTWGDYYSRRSRRLKKGNNLIANRLRKAFKSVDVARTVVDAGPAGRQALSELLELSGNSWKRELPTALHRTEPRAWVDELRQRLGSTGALVLWSLRLDGALAAAELQLDFAGIVSALRAEVRQELESHGPGTFLGWVVLESLMDGGRTIYNMGPGLSDYKARWAESIQPLARIDWYSPTLSGLLLWLVEGLVRPTASRLRARLRAAATKPKNASNVS